MERTTWLLLSVALCLAACAHSGSNELPPPVDIDVEAPTGETENTDAGWFGLTERVDADGAVLELPRSFDTQLVDTTSAVKVNDRWMPEVQVLMSRDDLVDIHVAVSVRPIDSNSGEALVSDELERQAERTTDGNQTWLHLRRESAPWWRTVVFVPVEDTMWVVDFIGEGLQREQFDDFVVGTMEEAAFDTYTNDRMLDQARHRADSANDSNRRLRN